MSLMNLQKKLRQTSSGFTIIEVMIVLAIAALILLIVIIAIPQLQRSQRNVSRKDIMGRIKTEVDNYSGNNSGSLPTANNNANTGFNTGGGFPTRYLTGININDPRTGAPMVLATWTSDANVNTVGTIYYVTGRICSGETSIAGTARQYIMMTQVEGGARFCLDNQ